MKAPIVDNEHDIVTELELVKQTIEVKPMLNEAVAFRPGVIKLV